MLTSKSIAAAAVERKKTVALLSGASTPVVCTYNIFVA
jgi:4-hydroxy-3-methylbut-2-enyl diphosphate reductase IspH